MALEAQRARVRARARARAAWAFAGTAVRVANRRHGTTSDGSASVPRHPHALSRGMSSSGSSQSRRSPGRRSLRSMSLRSLSETAASRRAYDLKKRAALGVGRLQRHASGYLAGRMERLREAAKETGEATAEARRLAREGKWKELTIHTAAGARQSVKRGAQHGWDIARSEHSIVSLLYPADVDTSGTNLSDEQIVQIFWNTLVIELAVMALIHKPSDGGLSPVTMAIEGLIVVGPVAACAVITRLVFRWGNRGRKVKLKRERCAPPLPARRDRPAARMHHAVPPSPVLPPRRAIYTRRAAERGDADAANLASILAERDSADASRGGGETSWVTWAKRESRENLARLARPVARTWRQWRYAVQFWLAWAFAIGTFIVCDLTVLIFASQVPRAAVCKYDARCV